MFLTNREQVQIRRSNKILAAAPIGKGHKINWGYNSIHYILAVFLLGYNFIEQYKHSKYNLLCIQSKAILVLQNHPKKQPVYLV